MDERSKPPFSFLKNTKIAMPSLQSVSRFPDSRNLLFNCGVGSTVSEIACRPAKLNAKSKQRFSKRNRKNSTNLVYRSTRISTQRNLHFIPAEFTSRSGEISFAKKRRLPHNADIPASTHLNFSQGFAAEKCHRTNHSITPFFTLPENMSKTVGEISLCRGNVKLLTKSW